MKAGKEEALFYTNKASVLLLISDYKTERKSVLQIIPSANDPEKGALNIKLKWYKLNGIKKNTYSLLNPQKTDM